MTEVRSNATRICSEAQDVSLVVRALATHTRKNATYSLGMSREK
eukprot:CAMPEP_0177469686 /NCGR_PEP_ID=MMETSP0369-20130122/19786_1 /TAXON_ID=447022 ORGANISM="Scrippsiella hangoei-like, Strain SHHI-4" /NCGR_SAMPLE_ID=MMETSP0369 /ASSEMBLY_ACC=CAM_ASM_000364 /LENGTH=43 /DNA_ID= /DNA_START= /DNA_END= /DNA_ORIENTATION=